MMACRVEFYQDRRDAGRTLARAIQEAGQDRTWPAIGRTQSSSDCRAGVYQ